MRCPRCENVNPDGTIICSQCGTYLKRAPLHSGVRPQAAQEPTTSVIQPNQALKELQAGHAKAEPQSPPPPPEVVAPIKQAQVPAEINLSKLPVGPIKTLFERGGTLDQKFALKRELGRGGMGFVFAGEDLSLGREVAVKILPPHYNDDENVVIRFQREARAMASLDHPNIVTVYSIGDGDGLHYFVMKKLHGETLAHELKRQELGLKERLSPVAVVNLIAQVCSGLAHAHSKGLLHRDIKPGNLMLSDEGFVSIMDFGIVKLLNTTDTMMQTAHGKIFGTPEYMSPEQAMGKGGYTPASDLYALAVVTYELLCGEIPFKGETPIEIILQHIRAKVPTLPEALSTEHPGLNHVLQKAMAKSPAERYTSARELSDALREAVSNQSPKRMRSATPPELPPIPSAPRLDAKLIKSDFQLETLNLDEPESIELEANTDELSELIDIDDIRQDDLEQMEGALQVAVAHERRTRGYEDVSERHLNVPQEVISAADPSLNHAPFTQELASVQSLGDPLIQQGNTFTPSKRPVALKVPPRPPARSTAPVSTAPVATAPVSTAPVSTAPMSTAPVSTAPVSTAPVSTAPVSTAPVSTAPVSTAPIAPAHHLSSVVAPMGASAPQVAHSTPKDSPATPLDSGAELEGDLSSGEPIERVHVEEASSRKGHYRGLPIRRKGT